MSNNVVRILKYFTGELEPYKKNTKDSRRMFVDELSQQDQETKLLSLNLVAFLFIQKS
jgi:hypothetical protein